MDVLVFLLLSFILVAQSIAQAATNRRRVAKIGIRVHVNGTRGKSSVTRLIAAGLRASGIRTLAKVTGTRPALILPDGSERLISRSGSASIDEQFEVVRLAAELNAQALVIECMALRPHLQSLSELRIIRSTCGVITNVRPDHLAEMGPTEHDIALALAGTVPVRGVIFLGDVRFKAIFEHAAEERHSELVLPGECEVSDLEMGGFSYLEHKENVSLALKVCERLGVSRDVAIPGMWRTTPDPGVLRRIEAVIGDRRIFFWNGFAANDPISSQAVWKRVLENSPGRPAYALLNLREDRPERTIQLCKSVALLRPDRVFMIGTGLSAFKIMAAKEGYANRLISLENKSADDIVGEIAARVSESAVVIGLGNMAGLGGEIVERLAEKKIG